MKKIFTLILLSILCISLNGCEFIEGVFKAGVWIGILVVLFIITFMALIIKFFKE